MAKTIISSKKKTAKTAKTSAKTPKNVKNPKNTQSSKSPRNPKKPTKIDVKKTTLARVAKWFKAVINDHKTRRPHRSFRHTPRKIHQRPLQIEGYFRFSRMVLGQIWRERKFYLSMVLMVLVAGVLLTGIVSQDHYNNLKTALNQTYKGGDSLSDQVFKTGLLLLSTASGGGFNPIDTEGKQLLSALLFLVAWLATIWYLRNRLAGHKVKFRDSLYNSCGPMVATAIVGVYMLLQMIPLLIFVIFYAAAVNTGYASQGVEAMVLYSIMAVVVSLTIYWLEGSFLALIVATLPGVYPLQAIKIAGDLTIGRRLKILYRLLWHGLQVFGLWVMTALPMALLYNWLSGRWQWLRSVPVIPALVTLLSVCSILWTYTYIYFLYRRIVEDESQSA